MDALSEIKIIMWQLTIPSIWEKIRPQIPLPRLLVGWLSDISAL